MKVLKILDWPSKRYYGETHHFYRWRDTFLDHGLKVEIYYDHKDKRLHGSDYLLIHSRYFEDGWQNILTRTSQNEDEIMAYLFNMKNETGRLIWFDAADSTGSSDFPIIPLVDVFMKKQRLRDINYYTSENLNDLRIWLNPVPGVQRTTFAPCPKNQLHKIKLGWNLALNDYRYYGYKMSRLSNYLAYSIYPTHLTPYDKKRKYDLAFRGTIHKENGETSMISYQRNYVLGLFEKLNLIIATGKNVSKAKYWKELRDSKLSISPFGWGEICYRDFETFIAGSVLIKPLMSHLETYPDLYIENVTYVPVSWGLQDLEEKLEHMVEHYESCKQIAKNAQLQYFNAANNAHSFINSFKQNID
ncbi:glycosyltransferase family 1 protein [Pedobacter sp.]|uniref:glycosyltransferase family 1 protein n=1 Tax=Pedobacter sp. TaxID=1411316 RepID=UPI003D7FA16B